MSMADVPVFTWMKSALLAGDYGLKNFIVMVEVTIVIQTSPVSKKHWRQFSSRR